jgi:hypothetical protein
VAFNNFACFLCAFAPSSEIPLRSLCGQAFLYENLKALAHAAGQNHLARACAEHESVGPGMRRPGHALKMFRQTCSQQKFILTLEAQGFEAAAFARTFEMRPINRRRNVLLAGMREHVAGKAMLREGAKASFGTSMRIE